jgi:thiol-disulfide isomerase/thioredoxin
MPHVRFLCLGLAALGLLLSAGAPARAEDPAPAAEEVPIPWVKNWTDAKAQAKREKKDLLIDFTGSDWCGWCKKLEADVFSHAAFLDVATKQYVFVFLDFPHDPELKKQVVDPALNTKLNEGFRVRGFPTIVLATADGNPYARTGYQEGGPAGYLKHLEELRANREKIETMLAKGKKDFEAFKAGFQLIVESEFLGHPDYAWTVDHAALEDADGSKGLKPAVDAERARQRSRVEELALQKILQTAKGETPPWEEIQKFLLASKDLNGNALAEWSIRTADWLAEEKRYAEAKVLYQLPLRDPDIAANPRAQAYIGKKVKGVEEAMKPPAEEPKPEEPKPDATPK